MDTLFAEWSKNTFSGKEKKAGESEHWTTWDRRMYVYNRCQSHVRMTFPGGRGSQQEVAQKLKRGM